MSIDPTAIKMTTDPLTRRFVGIARHGNVPFDVPFVTPITDDLWTGGCENGLVLPHQVRHLVSLYPWESYKVKHELHTRLEVRQFDDLQGADDSQMNVLAQWVNTCRRTGVVLVHCQAGLNRSSRLAALALIYDGMDPDDAIALLREKRSPAVLCNPEMEEWLRSKG